MLLRSGDLAKGVGLLDMRNMDGSRIVVLSFGQIKKNLFIASLLL